MIFDCCKPASLLHPVDLQNFPFLTMCGFLLLLLQVLFMGPLLQVALDCPWSFMDGLQVAFGESEKKGRKKCRGDGLVLKPHLIGQYMLREGNSRTRFPRNCTRVQMGSNHSLSAHEKVCRAEHVPTPTPANGL